jgi:hypothetical protein
VSTSSYTEFKFKSMFFVSFRKIQVCVFARVHNELQVRSWNVFVILTDEPPKTGWYFGKTAGLLGTLDNEPSDDMLSSNGYVESDIFKFTESWSLNENSCNSYTSLRKLSPTSQTVEVCDSYFKHKTSPLFTCFSVVNITLFVFPYHR